MKRYVWGERMSGVVLAGLLAGAASWVGCSSRGSNPEAGGTEVADTLTYPTANTTLEAMVKAGGEVVPPSDARAAAPDPGSTPTPAFDEAFTAALEEYYTIRKALAGDSDAGVSEAATRLKAALQKVKSGPLPGRTEADNEGVREALGKMEQAADALAGKQGLEADREIFGKLSAPTMYLVAFHYHVPANRQPYVYYCPMKQLAWLQDVKSMGNPYYGAKMLVCGEVVPRASDSSGKHD